MKPSVWLESHDWIQRNVVEVDDDENVTGACLLGCLIETGYDGHQSILQEICLRRYGMEAIADVNDYKLTQKEEAIELLKKFETLLDERGLSINA